MRVFVAGATGVLGRPLVRELVRRGHDVAGLARSDANEGLLRSLGATPRRADLFDAPSLVRAAEGAEVVVRAATHIPSGRMRAAAFRENDRVRREGTRALLAAAREVGARYVQESIAWVARPPGGGAFDETSPPHPDATTASALDAERTAQLSGVRSATLRFGFFYGDAPHVASLAPLLRRRAVPVTGDAPLSFTFVDDAARATADAAEAGIEGLFHVVDAAPARWGEFLDAYAEGLGAPRPRRMPAWVGALAVGRLAQTFVTTPMRTTAERFRRATGWKPAHPSTTEGVRAFARSLQSGPR